MNFTQLTLTNGPRGEPGHSGRRQHSNALGVVNGSYSMLLQGQAGVITHGLVQSPDPAEWVCDVRDWRITA